MKWGRHQQPAASASALAAFPTSAFSVAAPWSRLRPPPPACHSAPTSNSSGWVGPVSSSALASNSSSGGIGRHRLPSPPATMPSPAAPPQAPRVDGSGGIGRHRLPSPLGTTGGITACNEEIPRQSEAEGGPRRLEAGQTEPRLPHPPIGGTQPIGAAGLLSENGVLLSAETWSAVDPATSAWLLPARPHRPPGMPLDTLQRLMLREQEQQQREGQMLHTQHQQHRDMPSPLTGPAPPFLPQPPAPLSPALPFLPQPPCTPSPDTTRPLVRSLSTLLGSPEGSGHWGSERLDEEGSWGEGEGGVHSSWLPGGGNGDDPKEGDGDGPRQQRLLPLPAITATGSCPGSFGDTWGGDAAPPPQSALKPRPPPLRAPFPRPPPHLLDPWSAPLSLGPAPHPPPSFPTSRPPPLASSLLLVSDGLHPAAPAPAAPAAVTPAANTAAGTPGRPILDLRRSHSVTDVASPRRVAAYDHPGAVNVGGPAAGTAAGSVADAGSKSVIGVGSKDSGSVTTLGGSETMTGGSETMADNDGGGEGNLALVRKVGHGGFGAVWEARWRGAPAAVKVLVFSASMTREARHERMALMEVRRGRDWGASTPMFRFFSNEYWDSILPSSANISSDGRQHTPTWRIVWPHSNTSPPSPSQPPSTLCSDGRD